MEDSTYEALIAASRVTLHAKNGKVVDQINRARVLSVPLKEMPEIAEKAERALTPVKRIPPLPAPSIKTVAIEEEGDLDFWNGIGGFARDSNEYVVRLPGGQATPQPWINVISNERFGFHGYNRNRDDDPSAITMRF